MEAENKYKVELTPAKAEYPQLPNVGDEGGLKLEIESDANFLSTTKTLMVDLGSKALKGSLDLSNLILPSAMLSEYTRLEVIAFEYPNLCKYLTEAAKQTDPVERMKYIVAGKVGSIISSVQIQKACPPVPAFVGDELEAFNELGDRIHISHQSEKQDVSQVTVIGKHDAFKIEYDWEIVIKFRGYTLSNVSGKKAKSLTITFKDGSKVTMIPAEYEIDGAMSTSKVFRMANTTSTVEDVTNGIKATVQYLENPKKGGMLSGLWSKPAEIKKSDLNKIKVEIMKGDKVVSKGSGSYTSHLEIDGKCYWRVTDPAPHWDFEHEQVTKKMTPETQNLKALIKGKKHPEAQTLLNSMVEKQNSPKKDAS